jgi:hypothetical protein
VLMRASLCYCDLIDDVGLSRFWAKQKQKTSSGKMPEEVLEFMPFLIFPDL